MSLRTISDSARRARSSWRTGVLVLAVVVLTPSGAAASAPASVDCSGLTVASCYAAAKAAGYVYFAPTPVGLTCANDPTCDPFGSGEGASGAGALIPGDTGGNPACAAGPSNDQPCFYLGYTVPDASLGDGNGFSGAACGEPAGDYCYGSGATFATGSVPNWFAADVQTYGGSSAAKFSIGALTRSASSDLASDVPGVLLLVGGLVALALAVHFARKAIRA